ncbi:hypothetical protein TIFTF001_049695 [Ficus carica]|uniref:Uncharacterized protein n=1 Tax=Ficus carica TaxID=3494 RepID=A0AA87Z8D7_FICCA|nr:hypothetical protein TIFTF001_049684 [Ficus carica]GMN31527.1 hypothetical protein TIFTF001_049689 [Ficus carica]GMN31547.1 hypothetical protein TIFTF001_049690 [Ficus carica]GMN31564.1 hypothetical protein TIFTF001_049695 [Ficus carica]
MSSANDRGARLATASLGSATEGEEKGSATERGAANGFGGGWVLSSSSPLSFEFNRSELGFEFLFWEGGLGSVTQKKEGWGGDQVRRLRGGAAFGFSDGGEPGGGWVRQRRRGAAAAEFRGG